jgi:hypothetical protein
VKIGENNISTWAQAMFGDQIKGTVDVAKVNAKLDVEPGDCLVLNTRPAFLSVRVRP